MVNLEAEIKKKVPFVSIFKSKLEKIIFSNLTNLILEIGKSKIHFIQRYNLIKQFKK